MKISFIIPCYNAADTLHLSVNSVVKQGIEDYEIIIINDGSSDDTLKVAQKIKSENPYVIVLDKPNGGVSSARNLGIKYAKGDYLAFLDADDEFDPDFWNVVKPFAKQSHGLIIFGFDTEISPTKTRCYNNRPGPDLITDYLMGRVYIHVCSFLAKREIIQSNYILFDEETHFSEDKEFIVKVLLLENDYVYINRNLFHYKYRESSAMHVPVYSYRKSTSLNAMERVLSEIGDNQQRRIAALIQLKMTILLHIKGYLKTNCHDQNLWSKLEDYCSRYLIIKTPLMLNRYSIYVWLLGELYRLKYDLFLKVVKVL